jgi:hypothetical protein
MPKPWDRYPEEPYVWFSRFHDHYMMIGPERTLDEAYRRYQAAEAAKARDQQVQSGHNVGRRPPPKRAPGSWRARAESWSWASRAKSWDDDERNRVRKAHFEALKKMNAQHQTAAGAFFNKGMLQLNAIDWANLKLSAQYVNLMSQVINLQRLVMGMPVGVEVTHKHGQPGESIDHERAIQEASEESAKRFEASPEMYAAVLEVLAAHEVKPEPESATPLDHPAEEA